MQFIEQRYYNLFESVREGILILNADDGVVVDANPHLMNMLACSKDQLLQKDIRKINAFSNIDQSKHFYKELFEKEYVHYPRLPLETFNGKLVDVEFVSNIYSINYERIIQCNIREIAEGIAREKALMNDIEKKEALLREFQHRAKNSFNMITSLIRLRSNVNTSEETKTILEELTLRVQSIADLYSLLHETDSIYEVNIKTYCYKVISSMGSFRKDIVIKKHIEEISVSTKQAAVIGMILVELISNSIKYAFPGSSRRMINIELKSEATDIILIAEDNGIGLREEFDIAKIDSLGLHLVDLMVKQLDGIITFISGKGTKAVIKFPNDQKRNNTMLKNMAYLH